MMNKLKLFVRWIFFLLSADFFEKKNQEHSQGVKLLGSRSGPGSKLFAKVISRRQKTPLASKEGSAVAQWESACLEIDRLIYVLERDTFILA